MQNLWIVAFCVAIVFGIIFLVIRKKKSPLPSLLRTKERNDAAPEGRYIYLLAGTTVPVNGYYDCERCASGGDLDYQTEVKFGTKEANRRLANMIPTRRFFNKGEIFPECPNCKNLAGWTSRK